MSMVRNLPWLPTASRIKVHSLTQCTLHLATVNCSLVLEHTKWLRLYCFLSLENCPLCQVFPWAFILERIPPPLNFQSPEEQVEMGRKDRESTQTRRKVNMITRETASLRMINRNSLALERTDCTPATKCRLARQGDGRRTLKGNHFDP